MRTRVLGTVVVVASLALSASAAQAAVDMFFEVPDVTGQPVLHGESRQLGHANQIDVLSWSSGVSKAANPTGTKTSPTVPSFKDLSFTKYLDRSSPVILQAVAAGTTFGSAKLHIFKPGGDVAPPVEYVTLCFTGVRFTSQSLGGEGGEDRLAEDVSFSYQTIVERYQLQGDKGEVTDTIFGGWDLVRNLQASSCTP